MGRRERLRFAILSLLLLLCFALSTAVQAKEPERVLLLPLQIFAKADHASFLKEGLRSMLVSRLSGEGLRAVFPEKANVSLTPEEQKGLVDAQRAQALAEVAGVKYAIFGSVTALEGSYSLDLSLVDRTKTPPKHTRVSESATEGELIPKVADVAHRFRGIIDGVDYRRMMEDRAGLMGGGGEETTLGLFFKQAGGSHSFQPTGYTSLRMKIMSFDTGDLDGDGKAELAILDKDKLVLAHRETDTLVQIDRITASTGETFLKASLGDVDRDGRAEIYLVALYGERAQSRVLTWSDNRFQERLSMQGHLNAVKNSDTGQATLLYQDSRLQIPFMGPISIMTFGDSGKRLKPDVTLERMTGAQIYTLAAADINRDGMQEFIGLGERSYLHVWSVDGTTLWKGNENHGGTNNFVNLGEKDNIDGLRPRIELNPRIIVSDIDGDQKKEVLVTHNIAVMSMLENLRFYKTGRIIAYTPSDGSSLVSSWTTRKINYAIAALQSEGGTLYIAGHKGELSKVSVGSSRIMWFE